MANTALDLLAGAVDNLSVAMDKRIAKESELNQQFNDLSSNKANIYRLNGNSNSWYGNIPGLISKFRMPWLYVISNQVNEHSIGILYVGSDTVELTPIYTTPNMGSLSLSNTGDTITISTTVGYQYGNGIVIGF